MGANFDRSILLSRANIRKARGQTVAIVALVLLSSVMMSLWLILGTDYKQNFDRCHDRLNDGHVNLIADTDDREFWDFIEKYLKDSSDVEEYCLTDALFTGGYFKFGGGEIMQSFAVLEKETAISRTAGKFEITEDSDHKSGIYLPMLYGTGDNYSVGDTIEINYNGEKYEYTVCGFFNSAMLGSHNCLMMSLLLTEDKYKELAESPVASKSQYLSVRIGDKIQSEAFDTSIRDILSKKFTDVLISSNSYETIATTRYISQMICAAIMSAMAFLVLLIGIVVISSNVVNYIQENMQNLGALKAVGYTSKQLVSALIMQFSGISAVTAAAGIALSYCIFPSVNEMMIAQTGIPYTVKFLILPCLFTLLFISGIIGAAVYLSAKKIRRIEPITAIRQGITTHSFRKNRVPLDKTALPLQPALAVKTAFSGIKQNIITCITLLIISLVIVFSGVMFENMILDKQPFINMMAGEFADSCINVNIGREEEFLAAMKEDSRVEKVYLYTNTGVRHAAGISLTATISDDFSKVNNQSTVIEGRFPKYSNETAIAAKYAREKGLEVGDEIRLKAGENEEAYIITGFTQYTNQLGKDCVMTREGYEKLGSFQNVNYYFNLADGTDIDSFNSDISERFGSDINTTSNFLSIIEGTGGVYVSLATIITAVVLILSCIIIIFVMYLLVRTLLNNKKRDYGILKALGYTTGQLVLQTAMSFMPSVTISAAIGIFISMQIINPLLALFFSGLGIVKSTFSVPIEFNVIAGIGLILFAFAAACLMSLRVKKITPKEMITGE